jgi:hypothetical protein
MEKFELVLADDTPGVGRAGERVALTLSPADVHLPEELSTYMAGYHTPGGFRADDVSKIIPVDHDEDKYRTANTADAFKRVQVKGSMQGAIPEIDPGTSLDSYKVVEKFVGSFIPAQVESNATGNFKPRAAAARRCLKALTLDREYDVWDMLTTSGNWDSSVVLALSAGEKWNGGASANPIANIHSMLEASLQTITDLWMNYKVANQFLRDPAVRDTVRFLLGDGAVNQTMVDLLNSTQKNAMYDLVIPGLPPIHIVSGKAWNSSGVPGYILGSSFVVGTVTPPGVPQDGEEISTTYTFRRKGPNGVGFNTREFRIEGRGPLGGTMLVASVADVPKMTSNLVGGLITGVIA